MLAGGEGLVAGEASRPVVGEVGTSPYTGEEVGMEAVLMAGEGAGSSTTLPLDLASCRECMARAKLAVSGRNSQYSVDHGTSV